MARPEWHIYLAKIPYARETNYWVSFESDPKLSKTKFNIYNRCLPCIQNLCQQLKEGRVSITLGTAYNCWKVTAIMCDMDACIALLNEFENRFAGTHVWGKFGSGRPESITQAVVFHAENIRDRDWIHAALEQCTQELASILDIQISRACAVLYDDLLGDWDKWQETTPIKNPEKADELLEKIKKILYQSSM